MTVIPGYILQHEVGSGGFAQVWKGVHEASRLPVAIKLLTRPTQAFEAEARAMAAMAHPGIAAILDFGRCATDTPYLVVQWADEGTLADAIDLDTRRILDLLLEALAHAHGMGVLHLDIKPANVLLHNGGNPLLADFGLAELHAKTPESKGVRGTPAYMAPERFTTRAASPASDLYAVGCLAMQLLTGQVPFTAATWQELAEAHTLRPPPLERLPPAWRDWVSSLLQKAPRDRLQSAAEARASLLKGTAPTRLMAAKTPSGDTTFDVLAALPFDLAPPPPTASIAAQPLPDTWRSESEHHLPFAPAASGSVAMIRIRKLPTQGREAHRDTLWRWLVEVEGPAVIGITGPARCGSSHLAAWLVNTAVELGAAVRVPLGSRSPPGKIGITFVDSPTMPIARRISLHTLGEQLGRAVIVFAADERSEVNEILQHTGHILSIGPLTEAGYRTFLSTIISEATGWMSPLYQRTLGSPGRTLDLLDRGIHQGTVQPSPTGLTIEALPTPTMGTKIPLLPPDPLRMLEILAAWDEPARLEEWLAACDVPHPERLLPSLHRFIHTAAGLVSLRDLDLRSALRVRAPFHHLAAQEGVQELQRGRWWIRVGEASLGVDCMLQVLESEPRQMGGRIQGIVNEGLNALSPGINDPLRRRLLVRWGTLLAQARRFNELNELTQTLAECGGVTERLYLRMMTETYQDGVAEEILQSNPTPYLRMSTLHRLGLLRCQDGAVDQGLCHLEQAKTVALDQGWLALAASCQGDLAALLGRAGRHDACHEAVQQTIELAQRANDPGQESRAFKNLGDLHSLRNEPALARTALAHALRLAIVVGTPQVYGIRMSMLELDLRAGEPVRSALTRLRQRASQLRNATGFHTRLLLLESIAAGHEADADWARARLEQALQRMEAGPKIQNAVTRALLTEASEELGATDLLQRARKKLNS